MRSGDAPGTTELDRAVTGFQEGFSIMKEDINKAKKNFNAAIETAVAVKTDEASGEIDNKIQREKRSQVLFFSNCYLAYIDAVEKNADLAVKHLGAMLENKNACSSEGFYVFPSGAAQVTTKSDGSQKIAIDSTKNFKTTCRAC